MRHLSKKKTKTEYLVTPTFRRWWGRGVSKGGHKQKFPEEEEEQESMVSEPCKEKRIWRRRMWSTGSNSGKN